MRRALPLLMAAGALLSLQLGCAIYYLETREAPIEEEVAPDFTLLDTEGEAHTLSEMTDKGPVVVVFYRGTW